MDTKLFFDNVSNFYDNMTNADNIISARKKILKNYLTPEIKTAADLGCGTGSDSISLGLNGLDVTGFDISGKMIEKAKSNSKRFNLKPKFYRNPIDKIPLKFNGKFDIAVSLGNSIVLVEKNKIEKSIKRIYNILKSKSQFILQILNYTAIKENDNKIVNITQSKQNIYVRFYDFYDTHINFNILRFNKGNPKNFELISTKLYPYDKDFLFSVLKKTGFRNLKAYSALDKNKFNATKSKNLIIVANKI